jgi:hypothetical protein
MAQIQWNFSELTSTTAEISDLIAPRKLFMAVADCFGDKRTRNIAAVECSRSRHASRDTAFRVFVCWSVEVWQRRRSKISLKLSYFGFKSNQKSDFNHFADCHAAWEEPTPELSALSSGHIEVQTQQRDQHI